MSRIRRKQLPLNNVAIFLLITTAMGLVLPVRASSKDSDSSRSSGGSDDSGDSGASDTSDTPPDPCGADELECTGKYDDSRLPFPEDCTKYLRCTGSHVRLESCPAGQSFDSSSRRCKTKRYRCQRPCPTGIYHKYLTTTSSAVPLRPTPTIGHDMTTARLTHAVTTTSQPLSSQTTTSSSHPRPDSLSTLTTESSTAFQTSASSPPTQQVTSVRHDASTSYSHVVTSGHVTPSTVAKETGMTSQVNTVTSPSTSAAHAQQTTSGGSASSRVTTTSRDVTVPRDDVMPDMTSPLNPLLEGHRAEFQCAIRLQMTRVGNFSWYLDSVELSNDVNQRVKIMTRNQPSDGQWTSTLVLDPAHHSDSGVLQCVIYYGGVYMATNNASIFVLPRPSRVTIHPRAVTSERYLTHVITCTAHFPPVTSDVTTVVEWFVADPTVGKWEDVSENKLTIKPGVESSDNESLEVRNTSSGMEAVSRLHISVTKDVGYMCRWMTDAGEAESDTCTVSVITAERRVCESETSGGVTWSNTLAGRYDLQPCPPSFTGTARRYCSLNGVWSKPNLHQDCVSEKIHRLARQLVRLNDSLAPVSESELTSIVHELLELTEGPNPMSAADLSASVEVMLRVTLIYRSRRHSLILHRSLMDAMSQLSSRMLDDINAESWESLNMIDQQGSRGLSPMTSRSNFSSSEKLLWSISELSDIYAEQMIELRRPFTINTANFLLQINRSHTAMKLPQWDNSPQWSSSTNDSFLLPNSTWLDRTIERTDGYIYACSYARNLQNYLPQTTHDGAGSNVSFINSPVMSLSILAIPDTLDPPIVVTIKHLQEITPETQRSSCVFWNFTNGDWSSKNCEVTSSNRTHTSCDVSHLTSFAILVSPYTPTGDVALALSIISMIGCIISTICLVFTIVLYISRWKTLKSHRAVVLLNLCVALIVANVVFLAGVDKTRPTELCTVVAVLLHYFFLAAFFLMLVEGIQLCIYVFAVFHVHRKRDTAAMIFAAWFLSLVVVGISLGVTKSEGYGNDRHCWLSVETGLLWAFVVPAMLVVLANTVIVILVLRRISQTNVRSNAKRSKVKSLMRNILVILPILGLTWVFGVVAVNSDLVAFQFIFAIANSLQGVFIFIFHAFCRGKSAGSANKKSKSSGPSWNHSAPTPGEHSNGSSGSNQKLVMSDDRRQCISRRHHPYFKDAAMASAADDDSSSVGTDNSGYENELTSPPSTFNGTALASPTSRELARQSELVRDNSVFSNNANDPKQRRRTRKANSERPGLSRFMSDMSDISNSTTSTFVSTPSQSNSGLEMNERT